MRHHRVDAVVAERGGRGRADQAIGARQGDGVAVVVHEVMERQVVDGERAPGRASTYSASSAGWPQSMPRRPASRLNSSNAKAGDRVALLAVGMAQQEARAEQRQEARRSGSARSAAKASRIRRCGGSRRSLKGSVLMPVMQRRAGVRGDTLAARPSSSACGGVGVELVAGGDVGVAAVGVLRGRIDEQLVEAAVARGRCDAAQVGRELLGADVEQVHLQLRAGLELRRRKSTPRQSDSAVWKSG